MISEQKARWTTSLCLGLGVFAAVGLSAPPNADARTMSPKEIYKTYGKAVVLVFGTDGSAQGSAGTGSIITPEGRIITNAHVVAKNGKPFKQLYVYLKPDHLTGAMRDDLKLRYQVRLVDIDKKLDLALLEMVSPPDNLTVMPIGDPDRVEIGDYVVAIGHPETAGFWTMTRGLVSAVVKDFQGVRGKDIFQTDTAINRGNSGGPLINEYGHMIGINTSISRKASDGLAITGINFSLKASVPVEWLKRSEHMMLAYADPSPGGEQIAMVEPKPAPKTEPAKEKPTTIADGDYTIKENKDGEEIVITVVEPEEEEEIADVQWSDQNGESASTRRKMRSKKKKEPTAQIITKRRPYDLDNFVSEKVKEMRALSKDMDEMHNEIEKRLRGKTRRPKGSKDGLGLW